MITSASLPLIWRAPHMRRAMFILFSILLAGCASGGTTSRPRLQCPDYLMVRFHPSFSPLEVYALSRQIGLEVIDREPGQEPGNEYYLVQVTEPFTPVSKVLFELKTQFADRVVDAYQTNVPCNAP